MIQEPIFMSGPILITGGGGRLGAELKNIFPDASFPSSSELDITDAEEVSAYIRKASPSAVIHAAAMTDANACEKDRDMAWRTNVEGTVNVLKAFRAANPDGYFVYMSTAGVFKCDRGGYDEGSADYGPVNFYCLTKLCGEMAVRSFAGTLVVRTNFVPRGPWPHAKAFTDRFGTYLYADDVAAALKDVFAKRPEGVVHICGDRCMSMYEIARLSTPSVGKTTTEEMGSGAVALPKDMSLVTKVWHPYKLGFASGGA